MGNAAHSPTVSLTFLLTPFYPGRDRKFPTEGTPKMRIDFYRPLLDFSGEVLRDGDKPLAFGVVAVNAPMGADADEQNLDGSEKVRRYQLATSIHGANGPLDVPAEDITSARS